MSSGLDLHAAWRRNDPALEGAAIGFWRRLDILPPGVTPEARARELCTVASLGGEVVGVTTATIETLPFLRGRFAMLRSAVAPAHRRSLIAVETARFSRQVVELWSREHPEEGVLGLGAFIQSAAFATHQKRPAWPRSGLNLVGYTEDGQQIRIAWFDHAEID